MLFEKGGNAERNYLAPKLGEIELCRVTAVGWSQGHCLSSKMNRDIKILISTFLHFFWIRSTEAR